MVWDRPLRDLIGYASVRMPFWIPTRFGKMRKVGWPSNDCLFRQDRAMPAMSNSTGMSPHRPLQVGGRADPDFITEGRGSQVAITSVRRGRRSFAQYLRWKLTRKEFSLMPLSGLHFNFCPGPPTLPLLRSVCCCSRCLPGSGAPYFLWCGITD